MENARIIEYKELFEEVKQLRAEIPRLIDERDELLFVICENLKDQYMYRIGALEYKLYEAKCVYYRLKRKIQLIITNRNHMKAIDLEQIEAQLDSEMKEYEAMLCDRMQEIKNSMERLCGKYLTETEMEELKSMYRKIVKALHPDLNPELPKEKADLFFRAVEAYKNGDLDMIRLICEMVSDSAAESKDEGYFQLLKAREKLFVSVANIRKEIENIKQSFPYNMKSFLEDYDAVEEKKLEIEGEIFDWKEAIKELEKKIEELLK